MTRVQFDSDDRFTTLADTDVGCHGGDGPRDIREARAIEWMLDPDNDMGYCAVLDPEDNMVATLKGDRVKWGPLSKFIW